MIASERRTSTSPLGRPSSVVPQQLGVREAALGSGLRMAIKLILIVCGGGVPEGRSLYILSVAAGKYIRVGSAEYLGAIAP